MTSDAGLASILSAKSVSEEPRASRTTVVPSPRGTCDAAHRRRRHVVELLAPLLLRLAAAPGRAAGAPEGTRGATATRTATAATAEAAATGAAGAGSATAAVATAATAATGTTSAAGSTRTAAAGREHRDGRRRGRRGRPDDRRRARDAPASCRGWDAGHRDRCAPPGRGAGGRGAADPGGTCPWRRRWSRGCCPAAGPTGRPMPDEPPEVNGLLPGRGRPDAARRHPAGPGPRPRTPPRRQDADRGSAPGRQAAREPTAPTAQGRREQPARLLREPRRAPGQGWVPRGRRAWGQPTSSRRPSWREPSPRCVGGCRGGEGVPQLAYDGGLDRRGGRPDELTDLVQLGHDGLALDTELFRELVDPDLCHISPV